MGLVYAAIELINGDDLAMVRRYKIGEDEVRRMHVNMLVDTGSYNLCSKKEYRYSCSFR